MRPLNWQNVERRLKDDVEFAHASRRWTTTLRLDFGSSSRRLSFHDGVLEETTEASPDDDCALFISAPESDWEQLLAATPRPFYQELVFAAAHLLGGDVVVAHEQKADVVTLRTMGPIAEHFAQRLGSGKREAGAG